MAKRKSSVRMRRPGSGGRPSTRVPRRTPGAGNRTPGAGSETGRQRRADSGTASASGAGITAAPRQVRSAGSVAGRRVQGLGLAMKLSLAIAILVVMVVGAWGIYQANVLRRSMEDAIKRQGAHAALTLGRYGRDLIAEYAKWKEVNADKTWEVRSLAEVVQLIPEGSSTPVRTETEDAVILVKSGATDVLLASAEKKPQHLEGNAESIEGRTYSNVRCVRGTYVRDNRNIPALQFVVDLSIQVESSQKEGTARLIISTTRVDQKVNDLTISAVIAGVLCVLAGVAVSYFLASGIVRPVRSLMRDMDIVSRGDFDHITKRTSSDEVGLLAMAFNDMTKSLKVARELERESERFQGELDTAREIQAHLLPAKIPHLPGFDIYQHYGSAKEVGGDYFDFIPVDRENLGVVVADVSGKGIPGSMVMSQTRAVLRMLATGNTSASGTLAQTNGIVARDIKRGMFVTAIYCILNVRQRTLTVASAGHNPMVLFRARTGQCELVNPAGIALGFDKGPIFNRTVKEQTLQLYKGDRVVLYTDGVVEAMDEQHEEYGDERFYKWVQANARTKSRSFVAALLKDLDAHRGNAEQHDDITVVTIRVE